VRKFPSLIQHIKAACLPAEAPSLQPQADTDMNVNRKFVRSHKRNLQETPSLLHENFSFSF
jgi:hypothetical protein